MGIIDDYFDGYYSEEMIESQVINPRFATTDLYCLVSIQHEVINRSN